MKIKMLVAPIMIVASIAIVIWGVVPSFQLYNESRKNLETERAKLSDLRLKNEKAGALASELNSNSETRKVIFDYIPSERRDDEILENLDSIARNSGVSVFNINIAKEVDKSNLETADAAAASGTVSKNPQPKEFRVDVGFSGSYENVKSYLSKIRELRRFNNIDSIKISKQESDDASNNILKVLMSLSFNYLKESDSAVDADNGVFTKGKFDLEIVELIKNKNKTQLIQVQSGPVGKSNPFMP